MSTSGSYDFTVTRDDIITDAFGAIGIGNEGENLTGDMTTRASRMLNMIAQQFSSRADGAQNMKMWTREEVTLFPQYNQYKYNIGPAASDDYATAETYDSTTIAVAGTSGASTVEVASSSGMAASDYFLVMLDSGSYHQTTITAITSNTCTMADTLGGAAAVGKNVYAFTNKSQKPLDILYMLRRESNGDDSMLDKLNLGQYYGNPDKDAIGDPTSYYYEEKVDNGTLFFDTAITDASDFFVFKHLRPIQDFDASTDNPEFPKIWFLALVYQLAINLCPIYGKPITQDLKLLRDEALSVARADKPDTTTMYFQPNRDMEEYHE